MPKKSASNRSTSGRMARARTKLGALRTSAGKLSSSSAFEKRVIEVTPSRVGPELPDVVGARGTNWNADDGDGILRQRHRLGLSVCRRCRAAAWPRARRCTSVAVDPCPPSNIRARSRMLGCRKSVSTSTCGQIPRDQGVRFQELQGRGAELEEVGVDADAARAEHADEDLAQPALGLAARRYQRRGCDGRALRQELQVDLAVGGEGDFVEHHDPQSSFMQTAGVHGLCVYRRHDRRSSAGSGRLHVGGQDQAPRVTLGGRRHRHRSRRRSAGPSPRSRQARPACRRPRPGGRGGRRSRDCRPAGGARDRRCGQSPGAGALRIGHELLGGAVGIAGIVHGEAEAASIEHADLAMAREPPCRHRAGARRCRRNIGTPIGTGPPPQPSRAIGSSR